MSEPKLISPLLDGFVMGDPISNHDGVRCCPAMQVDSDKKYIVKVISIPASQVKVDALLLTGAFADADSAAAYFKDLAEGVVEEAVLLQRLSRLEGFVPYENWQVAPMDEGETGYDVYLTGNYRMTLERYARRETMTHLSAVNLGLDLCAALAVCRRSGYLYVDLKPENICICDDHEFRISDLGFVKLDSLAYASLPERYLSSYTPPEIADAYSALNDTMDVYAAGMILYQIYNGGELPFEGRAPAEPLSAPQYADSDMAQIILKACDPNPEVRWADPLQMGQALVTYMQSNSVNDTPIIVPPVEEIPEILMEEPVQPEENEEPSTEDVIAEVDEALDSVGVTEEMQEAYAAPAVEEAPEEPSEEEESDAKDEEIAEESGNEESCEESAEETVAEEACETSDEVTTEDAPEEEEVAEVAVVEEESNLEAEAAAIQEELGVTEEVSHMLAQAENLIAHETPEGVVAPEPVEITVPAAEEEEPEEAEEIPAAEEESPADEEVLTVMETDAEEEVKEAEQAPKKSRKGWLAAIVVVLLAAVIGVSGYLFYQHYYLQTVLAINLTGTEDRLTVQLNTQVSDELLTVLCTDTYGNTIRKNVVNGIATFQDLKPSTRYKISVEISGFHKLIGATTGVHVTSDQTSIVSFTAATGSEDGSVILNFTVQGPDTGEWKVTYTADGEEEKSITFSGRMVTLNGLTIGKEYTFRLEPTTPLYMVGEDTVTYTASAIVYAENLAIQGFRGNAMTVTWKAPENVTVNNWVVRCYNDVGFDKTITVTDTTAVFEDLDSSAAYTVEVNAAGMTLGTRAFVSANSVSVTNIQVDDSNRNQLSVSWSFEGTAPEGGWLLLYSIDSSEAQQVVKCGENSGVIAPIVPGSRYTIAIQPANGSTVFGGTYSYEAPAAQVFSGYLLTASNMEFRMCKTPAKADWTQYDVPAADYTTTFAVGSNASFAVKIHHEYNTSPDIIVTLFVIRDAEGKIVSTATQSRTWTSMWYRGFGRINIPALPQTPGNYTVEIYFNGTSVTSQQFTMV